MYNDYITGKRNLTKGLNLLVKSVNTQEQMILASQSQLMTEFMTVMSVAHEVVAEDPTKISANGNGEDIDYEEVDPQKLKY